MASASIVTKREWCRESFVVISFARSGSRDRAARAGKHMRRKTDLFTLSLAVVKIQTVLLSVGQVPENRRVFFNQVCFRSDVSALNGH
jgi:hypothetical protein